MAENIDVAQAAEVRPVEGSGLDHLPMRDEEGQLRHEFVEEIARAIHAADRPLLCEVVAELHEADLGDLIAALEPDDRVTLVELTGTDFDFSALNEVDDAVREEILEELEPETVAEGVRELESDDAVELLEGLDEADQEEILEKPALSGEFRRPADAVRVHRGAAGLDRRPGDRLHARHARSAGPVLRNLRG
jgi:magnesium transporter